MAGSRESRAIVVAALLVAAGIAMVRLGFGAFEPRGAILALLTGWIVGASGLVACVRAPSSRTGSLLVLAAVAWYVANLQRTSIPLLDDVAGPLHLVYAAILVQAILTFPDGRRSGTLPAILVVAAYVVSVLPSPTGAILVAATLLLGLAAASLVRVPARSHTGWPAVVGLLFALTLSIATAIPWVMPGGSALDPRPAIEIALAITAASLSAATVRASERRLRVIDLVVELGREGSGGLARQLASAVGDPTLEVAYALGDEGSYVDATGREVALPAPGSGRSMTRIDQAGRPVAVLIHDPATSADPRVRSAIARAAELSGANARLQAEVRTQLVDVAASRRRLVEAADEERRVLRTRLTGDLEPRLDDLEAALVDGGLEPDDAPSAMGPLAQLRETRREMTEIADGLHPRALEEQGLAGALQELVGRSPVPVHVRIDAPIDGSPASQAAVYFVCSEALTNAAKHAAASSISILLRRSGGDLVVEIEDDGVGGADPRRGTGLQGLRDRVEALGGSLWIAGRPGHGTRLVASVPGGDGSAPPPPGDDGAGRGLRRLTRS